MGACGGRPRGVRDYAVLTKVCKGKQGFNKANVKVVLKEPKVWVTGQALSCSQIWGLYKTRKETENER